MRHRFTERATYQYWESPLRIQRAFDRRLVFLLRDLRHPSLRAKKYDETGNIWQARITKGRRFYFSIDGEIYIILSITPHPK